jgi:hypothetical protein
MINFWLGAMVGGMFGAFLGVLLMSAMTAASRADDQAAWFDMFRKQSNGDNHKG